MDEWEKFNETLLPEKDNFYSNLNMGNITDADYMQAKEFFNDFEIKNLCEYHDLYLKSDTLLLVNVSEDFRKRCLEIYLLDPPKFISAPGLAWQAALKKNKKGKLEGEYDTLLIDIQKLIINM